MSTANPLEVLWQNQRWVPLPMIQIRALLNFAAREDSMFDSAFKLIVQNLQNGAYAH
jgi:hypothetical protein